MILSCPDCSTRFAIDVDKLGPDGRRVKCGKCAHVWFELAPHREDLVEDELVLRVTPLEPEEQSHIPVRNLPALRRAKKARSAKLGWTFSVLFLAAVLAVLWVGREPIARMVPQMKAVYDTTNIAALALPGEGLKIEYVPKLLDDETLSIKGKISNISSEVREVPRLRVVVVDAEDLPVKFWEFAVKVRNLGPGEQVSFATKTGSVVKDAEAVNVFFIIPDDNR
jgi:predicted Zn finger-like uncharacterized protein